MINPRTRLLAAALLLAPACAHGHERPHHAAPAAGDPCPVLAREMIELGRGPMALATDVTEAARNGGNVSAQAIAAVGPQFIGMLASTVGAEGETRLTRLVRLQQRYQSGCQLRGI